MQVHALIPIDNYYFAVGGLKLQKFISLTSKMHVGLGSAMQTQL